MTNLTVAYYRGGIIIVESTAEATAFLGNFLREGIARVGRKSETYSAV